MYRLDWFRDDVFMAEAALGTAVRPGSISLGAGLLMTALVREALAEVFVLDGEVERTVSVRAGGDAEDVDRLVIGAE